MEYNTVFSPSLLVTIPIIVVLLIIYLPIIVEILFKKWDVRIERKYVSSTCWFGLGIFCLLVDGHFLETEIAHTIFYIAGAIAVVNTIFSNISNLEKFKISKGSLSIEGENITSK